jgi:hypothetical protein
MLKPQHTHDCDQCQLLASDAQGDWYVCPNGGRTRSVICRRSSEPSDYAGSDLLGYAIHLPVVLGALARGLTLTETEVRGALASVITRNLPMDVIRAMPDDVDMVSDTIRAAIMRSPKPTA